MSVQNPESNTTFFCDCKSNLGSTNLTKIKVSVSYFGSVSTINHFLKRNFNFLEDFNFFFFTRLNKIKIMHKNR